MSWRVQYLTLTLIWGLSFLFIKEGLHAFAPLQITLAAVVQHLQILEQSGLVHTEKVGRVRTCCIEPAGFSKASQWIADRRSSWERKLDRLGDLLAEPEEFEP